ncbi:2-oxoisovalerate dehydrogenase subunit alpha mitochondrial-like-like, partial [Trifolium medium]|nr:2-oxoisovalerate dehydrogenase subunit alpha mitochondrial-like-like [Trifolium medium]
MNMMKKSINTIFTYFKSSTPRMNPNLINLHPRRFNSTTAHNPLPSNPILDQVSEDVAVKMYNDMVALQTMDTIFYEAQRQGRISFYVTTNGEEAINIASAAALSMDDVIFPQ